MLPTTSSVTKTSFKYRIHNFILFELLLTRIAENVRLYSFDKLSNCITSLTFV